jgi:hypothetical protein
MRYPLVADEPAATVGEDGRKASETCPLLLASPGREPSHAPPLRGHATADRVAAFACRVDEPANEPISAGTAKGEGGVPKELVRRRSVSALGRLSDTIPTCSVARSLFDPTYGSIWAGHVVGCRSRRRPITEIPVTMSAMFGKKVKEYVRFEWWILILIVVVFALRLGLSLAGVSNAEYPVMVGTVVPTIPKATEWVSINLVLLVGILYCAIAVQTRGFGTYKHLFPLFLFQTTVAHWLVGMGIILGIVTRHNNVFTALEHCGACGANGLKWSHAFGHMLLPPLVSLIAWLPASAILFVTRKFRQPGAFEGPLVVVLAKFVALAAIAVASLVLILGIMRFS